MFPILLSLFSQNENCSLTTINKKKELRSIAIRKITLEAGKFFMQVGPS